MRPQQYRVSCLTCCLLSRLLLLGCGTWTSQTACAVRSCGGWRSIPPARFLVCLNYCSVPHLHSLARCVTASFSSALVKKAGQTTKDARQNCFAATMLSANYGGVRCFLWSWQTRGRLSAYCRSWLLNFRGSALWGFPKDSRPSPSLLSGITESHEYRVARRRIYCSISAAVIRGSAQMSLGHANVHKLGRWVRARLACNAGMNRSR